MTQSLTRRLTRQLTLVAICTLVIGLMATAVTSTAVATTAAGAMGSPSAGTTTTTTTTTTTDGIFSASAQLAGPVTTGHIIEPVSGEPSNLAANGFIEQEYVASGTATAFKALSTPSDGKWSIAPGATAPYRTRIIVRRPANAVHFNGTVLVEWMNVSEGESAPDWDYLNPELMREGYAWVGVSAQAQAVNGGTSILGSSGSGLVVSEPDRYGSLHHPGDQYSLDMFAQIGRAIRAHPGTVLGDLRPSHMVAVGESQSAFYLTTFADAQQPRANTFDGIFIHSRDASGAPLSGVQSAHLSMHGVRIRTDLHVPVFMFETQTDLIELGYAAAQQPDTDKIRTWEVAGTSHADTYIVGAAAALLPCSTAVNSGPQHTVVQAAFSDFVKWVVKGSPPPSPPLFRLAGSNPPALALDKNGNVLGGVRTPAVDVPISSLSGAAPAGSSVLCSLFGSTTPFTQEKLAQLYGTKSHYLAVCRANLQKAIAQGFILEADRATLLAQAEAVQFAGSTPAGS